MGALEVVSAVVAALKAAAPALADLYALLERALGGEQVSPEDMRKAFAGARSAFDQALATLDAKHGARVEELRKVIVDG